MKVALGALAQHDLAAALAAAIAAWRERRVPIVADAIDVLSRLAPPGPPRADDIAPSGDTLPARLAAVVTSRVATSIAAFAAVARVDDPRVSRLAIVRLADPPFTGRNVEPLMLAFVTAIVDRGDHRLADHAAAIRAATTARIERLPTREAIFGALDRALATLAAAPPPAPTEAERDFAARVAALDKPQRTDADLLAAIYAAPDDDGPRAVYADFLQERGDPRGEFIVLQLANPDGPPAPRELELLKKHGKQWLGGIAPALTWAKDYSRTAFRRGFVATADIMQSAAKKLVLVERDPGWATVESLDRETLVSITSLLETAPLRALRSIDRPVALRWLHALAANGVTFPAITGVTFTDGADDRDLDPEVITRVFPALVVLTVRAPRITLASLRALARFPVAHVHLAAHLGDLRFADRQEIVAALPTLPPLGTITRVSLQSLSPIRTPPPPPITYILDPATGRYTLAVGR